MATQQVVKAAAVLVGAALALAGCSADALEADQVEEKIAEGLVTQGVAKPKSIECPEDLPAEEGATIECTIVTMEDDEHAVTVETTGVDGDEVQFNYQIDPQPKG